ncbi:MAG: hypothetical protein QXL94_06790 [Candidatus Parvarchaeum sp.]
MKSKAEHINWQKRTKDEHKDRILILLKENKTMRFKDFLAQSEKTGIRSEKGLSEVLQRLQDEGLIEKTHVQIEVPKGEAKKGFRGEALERPTSKKQIETYRLTTEGQKYQSWWLIHELLDFKDKNASYVHSLSSNYYNFGLSFDIVMSGKGRQLSFILPPIPQVETFIMQNVFKKIKEGGIKLEQSEGKILTSFEIDLSQFADTLIKIQSFIEDINSNKDIFSDIRLDFDKKEVNKLWHFDFLIHFSSLLGDNNFRQNLGAFLKNFSKDQKFYDLTQVDPKLFNRFVKALDAGKDPLKDKLLFKSLIVPIERGIGYYNIFDTYIKAIKIIRYGDIEFYETLSNLENKIWEKINRMSTDWSMREQRKFETKQKRDAK